MSNYRTVDALNTVPVGTRITDISSGTPRTWRAVGENMFEWDGVRVASSGFRLACDAGHVSEWTPIVMAPGEEWSRTAGDPRYRFVISVGQETVTYLNMDRGGDPSDIVENGDPVAFDGWTRSGGFHATQAQTRTLLTLVTRLVDDKAAMQIDLHAYLDSKATKPNSRIERIMTAHGMEARYADVPVEVTINGTVLRSFEASSLGVGDVDNAQVTGSVSIEVPFTAARTVTVKSPGDGCARLTEEMVRESLGFDAQQVAFTSTCPVCSQTEEIVVNEKVSIDAF